MPRSRAREQSPRAAASSKETRARLRAMPPHQRRAHRVSWGPPTLLLRRTPRTPTSAGRSGRSTESCLQASRHRGASWRDRSWDNSPDRRALRTSAWHPHERGGHGPRSSGTPPGFRAWYRAAVRSPRHSRGSGRRAPSYAEQSLETAAVEADDHLVIHRDDWHRHSSGLSDQLIASRGVLGDVLGRERDTMGRKKLFRSVARLSGRGPVDRDIPRAHGSLSTSRPPKTRRPTLNASGSVMPAPCSCWLFSHHARRCSSDRKKFSFVQRTVHARQLPGTKRVTHTMTS